MAYWGNNPAWQKLDPISKAAAMALLEADSKGGRPDLESAKNALGVMINRADKVGQDLGDHVSQPIYQPTIEAAQLQRLPRLLMTPEFQELKQLANQRLSGAVPDWVQGATHFLAPERTLLALEAEDPQKYRSWRGWTGFDPATKQYSGVLFRDSSHAFLAPEGRHSAVFGEAGVQVASAPGEPGGVTTPGVTEVAKTASPIRVASATPTPGSSPLGGSVAEALASLGITPGSTPATEPALEAEQKPGMLNEVLRTVQDQAAQAALVEKLKEGQGEKLLIGPAQIGRSTINPQGFGPGHLAELVQRLKSGTLGA